MKRIVNSTVLVVLTIWCNLLWAQDKSIHQEQAEYYKQFQFKTEKEFDQLLGTKNIGNPAQNRRGACNLEYDVYGWHPYWVGTAYTDYDYSLLSTFSYFSYELNPSTGSYSSIHSWKTSPSIDMALAAGCRVELCVTNFGSTNNNTFLTNATARQTLIDSLISLVNYRNAHGVNIDFEGISGSNRNDFTSFMQQLSVQLKAAIPGATVTMALYSVDWNSVFDIPALDPYVDKMIVMGYGYYYSGSSKAGPTDPLYSGVSFSSLNLIRTINYYLGEGITPSKLVMGLPYYGYEWETVDNNIPSNTTGNFSSSRTYSFVRNNTSGNYSNKQFNNENFTPYYVFQTGGAWRQAWVDDEYALGRRYDEIKRKGIGGIGIWALGYDNGYTELWDLIRDKLSSCAFDNCTDSIYDMGGPYGNHYDNEDYTFTIQPPNSTSLDVNFSEFSLEAGFDSLWLYDGTSTTDPLIGRYSGTNGPGSFTTTSNAVTFKFHSDGATKKLGWTAYYNCNLAVPPATPLAFCVLNESATSVRVKVKNDPDAIGYEVYKSTDGITFTGPTLYTGNDFVVSGLTSDVIHYIKLKAYNNDGSSGFTEVLAATPSTTVDNVLIVNGFDRATTGNTYDFIRQHGKAVLNYGYRFSSASNEAIIENVVTLDTYPIVDYILGEESTVDETFSSTEQSLVKAYLDNGGKLFVSGSEIGWDLDFKGSATDKDFYNNYLMASYVNDAPNGQSSTYYEVTDIVGEIFDGLGAVSFDNGTNGTYNVKWPDAIAATNSASVCMEYTNVTTQYVGVRYEGTFPGGATAGKLVNLGVPFETFYPEASANDVMAKVLDYFLDPLTPPMASNDVSYCDGQAIADITATRNYGGTLTWYSDAALTNPLGTGASYTPANTIGATTYYVTESYLTQESTADQVVVTIHAQPTINVSNVTITDTDCGLTNGSIVGASATGNGTLNYTWLDANNNVMTNAVSLTGMAAGVYHLSVSDDYCSNQSNGLTINEIGAPSTPSATGGAIYCAGNAIANLTASGSGGTLTWYSDAGLTNVITTGTTLSPGNITTTTTYYVTETQGGCESSADQQTITVNQIPMAEAGNNVTICNGESTQLSASGGTSYLWNNSLGTGASHTVSPNTTTTYIVSVTQNGCSSTDMITVSVTPNPTANAGNDVSICAGESAQLTATGGSSFIWDNGLGNGASHNVSPTTNTTYMVTVTQNGCTDTDQVNVSVSAVPVANAGNDQTVCAGSTVLLLASGGTSYVWDNGLGTGSSHNITVNQTKTYTVTVTTGNCSSTDMVNISVTQLPSANAGNDVDICLGESTQLIATGGISYNWDNGLGSGAIQSVTPTTNTTYAVTVSDGSCSSTDAVIVFVHNFPDINSSSVSITPQDCGLIDGAITNLSVSGTGTLIYNWLDATSALVGSALDLVNVVAGNYTLSVTDDYCSTTDSYSIGEINPTIPTISGATAYCEGETVNDLTSSVGVGTITWYSDVALNNVIGTGTTYSPGNITTTTTYYATETQGGCESSAALATITITANPVADAGNDVTICKGSNTMLTASGGTDYLWSTGGTSASETVSPVVNTTYTVTVSVNGCFSTASVMISVVDPPVADFNTTETVNYDPDFSVTFNNNSTNSTTYSWNFGDGNTSTSVSPTHTYGALGTYSITLTAGNGICTDDVIIKTDYIQILPTTVTPVYPVAAFDVVNTTVCEGSSLELVNQSQDADSYEWHFMGNGLDITSTAMDLSVSNITAGQYDVTLTATNSDGSDLIMNNYTITVVQPPVASMTVSDTSVVPNEVITFTNNSIGGNSYCFNFADGDITCGNNTNIFHLYTMIGDYEVALIANGGACDNDTDFVMIHVIDPATLMPVAAFEFNRSEVCEGDTFTVKNTSMNATSYAWNVTGAIVNDGTAFEPVFTVTSSVSVSVNLSVDGGVDDTTHSINVLPLPVVSFTASDTVVDLASNGVVGFYNNSMYGETYSWNFGDGHLSSLESPWNNYDTEGKYTVGLLVANSCGGNSEVKIRYIEVIRTTGVEEQNTSTIDIYPNPVSEQLYVAVNNQQPYTIIVLNALGQRVLEETSLVNSTTLSVDTWAENGVYTLQIVQGGSVVKEEKIVVVK